MYAEYGKTTRSAGLAARLYDTAARFFGQIGAFAKALEGHRAVRRLADLDDRILDDIGLTRGDVEQAVLQPLMTDPRQDLALARQYRIWNRHRPIRRR
ncbi:MAG TPA: DUF1127 domain-containing protein [Afifellaceae bacterium]|nr:DUF1127 domain-containing protein [Afifellaceae bacterium]